MHTRKENIIGFAGKPELSAHYSDPSNFQSAVNAARFRAQKQGIPVLVIPDGNVYRVMRHSQPLGPFAKGGAAGFMCYEVEPDGRVFSVSVTRQFKFSL